MMKVFSYFQTTKSIEYIFQYFIRCDSTANKFVCSFINHDIKIRKIRQLRKLFTGYFYIIPLDIRILLFVFRAYIHSVDYDAFRQVSHIRPLNPVASGNFIKYWLLEFPHDRTFLVKHIKTTFVMKYFHNLAVPGHEHIDVGSIARIK